MAWDQITLQEKPNTAESDLPELATLKEVETGHMQLQDFMISIPTSNNKGSISYKGMELFTQFPEGCFWRPPTDNDGVKQVWMSESQVFAESGFRKG